jgi:hypothetical protein
MITLDYIVTYAHLHSDDNSYRVDECGNIWAWNVDSLDWERIYYDSLNESEKKIIDDVLTIAIEAMQ